VINFEANALTLLNFYTIIALINILRSKQLTNLFLILMKVINNLLNFALINNLIRLLYFQSISNVLKTIERIFMDFPKKMRQE